MAKPVEPFTLMAAPWLVEFALLSESGATWNAWALPLEVFVEAEAEPETPGPIWTAAPPEATAEVAVAVVAVAARAGPASRASAATAAKSLCIGMYPFDRERG